jgi:hypothetical protein
MRARPVHASATLDKPMPTLRASSDAAAAAGSNNPEYIAQMGEKMMSQMGGAGAAAGAFGAGAAAGAQAGGRPFAGGSRNRFV